MSGTGSCQSAPYAGDTQVTVSCTVSWTDGFTGTQSYYGPGRDLLSDRHRRPRPRPRLERLVQPPRLRRLNRHLVLRHRVLYARPPTPAPATTSATVAATCIDNAGKTVTAVSAPFAYDATPPALSATATAGDQSVALSWQAAGDVAPIASVQVTRRGGTTAAAAATVYSGDGSGFTETHLKNGVHYTYTITARDAAGNVAVQTLAATPAERLLSPTANAHVAAPPMLTWTAVPGATYYNVQLFRADPTKVLSIWPKHAGLQLHRTWRFDGRRYRLKPGKYRWYVWPGFGRRSAGRYGHMVGSGTFVVVR